MSMKASRTLGLRATAHGSGLALSCLRSPMRADLEGVRVTAAWYLAGSPRTDTPRLTDSQ